MAEKKKKKPKFRINPAVLLILAFLLFMVFVIGAIYFLSGYTTPQSKATTTETPYQQSLGAPTHLYCLKNNSGVCIQR